MNSRRTAVTAVVLCATLLSASACKKDEPKASADAAPAPSLIATPATAAARAPTIAPGVLNKFFPKEGDGGFVRVFAPDKEGYAEAKLLKNGKELAVVSITDAERLAYARAKYGGSTEKVEGFPVLEAKNQTSVLVKERFQVTVVSATLDHEARKALLAEFDLKGL